MDYVDKKVIDRRESSFSTLNISMMVNRTELVVMDIM